MEAISDNGEMPKVLAISPPDDIISEKGGDRVNKPFLQQEVLSCVWSGDLRNYVTEHNYTFSSAALLSIAYHFAPNYDERLRLLQLLADHAPDVSELAAKCIRFQHECLERFCQQGENEVYELRIQDDPEAYEERYLCASYQTALDMIDGYYREYDFICEQDSVRYVITKRIILQPADAFREDEVQVCILRAGKNLVSAEIWRNENDPKHELAAVEYPNFIPHLSAVRYQRDDLTIGRGVCLVGGIGLTDSFYVIPFDNEILRSRAYEEHLGNHWHEHIPGPCVEVCPVEDLTEEEKSDYLAFVAYWKQQEQNGLL